MAKFEILWEAPEYEHREKGVSWYWITIIVAAIMIAIILDALAYKRLSSGGQKAPLKGIVISVAAGLLMGFFYKYVAQAMGKIDVAKLDLLIIENVGNLVCPSSYDLGERIRVALLSVTEGEDKPLKYPTLFNSADAAVITKIDIAGPCDFDREAALKNINEIRPGIRIFETSAKTGAGMEEWLGYLAAERAGWNG